MEAKAYLRWVLGPWSNPRLSPHPNLIPAPGASSCRCSEELANLGSRNPVVQPQGQPPGAREAQARTPSSRQVSREEEEEEGLGALPVDASTLTVER